MASRKYLFVDDRWIAKTHAVHRRIGQPQKHFANPLITADSPWERGINCYGTVLRDGERFRMWYQVINRTERIDPRFVTAVGYAESADGVHWVKPAVGAVHPLYGQTNLVMLSSGRSELCSPSVVRDPRRRRYSMMFFDAMTGDDLERLGAPFPPSRQVPGWMPAEGEGMFVATSADGIAWRRAPQPVFGGPSDTAAMTVVPGKGYFAVFKRSERDDRHFRVLAASESADADAWTPPAVVLEPDWRDPPGTEFYGMSPFDYFGNWLGLIWMYHNSPDDKSLDIQLATRADDAAWDAPWHRAADRAALLTVGAKGTWDAGRVYVASGPVVAPPGDEDAIWLYYGGANVRHDDNRYKEHGIGLARLRLDGFAEMRADYFMGSLETTPLPVGGRRLRLNADSRNGLIAVAVLDARTRKELARSRVVVGQDGVSLPVAWEDGRLPEKGHKVRLGFDMKHAGLYSFWFDG